MSSIGERLQQQRKLSGLSQEALASRLGVSRQTLSKWETGAVLPDVESIIRFSALFGVTTDYLLLGTESAPSQNTPRRSVPWLRILGGAVFALSLTGLLVLAIIGSVGNWYIYASDGQAGMWGLRAFLRIKNLNWLFNLLLVTGVLGGLAAFLSPKTAARIIKE